MEELRRKPIDRLREVNDELLQNISDQRNFLNSLLEARTAGAMPEKSQKQMELFRLITTFKNLKQQSLKLEGEVARSTASERKATNVVESRLQDAERSLANAKEYNAHIENCEVEPSSFVLSDGSTLSTRIDSTEDYRNLLRALKEEKGCRQDATREVKALMLDLENRRKSVKLGESSLSEVKKLYLSIIKDRMDVLRNSTPLLKGNAITYLDRERAVFDAAPLPLRAILNALICAHYNTSSTKKWSPEYSVLTGKDLINTYSDVLTPPPVDPRLEAQPGYSPEPWLLSDAAQLTVTLTPPVAKDGEEVVLKFTWLPLINRVTLKTTPVNLCWYLSERDLADPVVESGVLTTLKARPGHTNVETITKIFGHAFYWYNAIAGVNTDGPPFSPHVVCSALFDRMPVRLSQAAALDAIINEFPSPTHPAYRDAFMGCPAAVSTVMSTHVAPRLSHGRRGDTGAGRAMGVTVKLGIDDRSITNQAIAIEVRFDISIDSLAIVADPTPKAFAPEFPWALKLLEGTRSAFRDTLSSYVARYPHDPRAVAATSMRQLHVITDLWISSLFRIVGEPAPAFKEQDAAVQQTVHGRWFVGRSLAPPVAWDVKNSKFVRAADIKRRIGPRRKGLFQTWKKS